MIRISDSVRIARPIEQVFEYTSDLSHYSEWADFTTDSEKITDGPIGVGTKFRWARELFGRRESTTEVTDYQPNVSVSLKTSGAASASGTFTFRSVGQETEFKIEMKGQTPKMLKPIEMIVAGRMKDDYASALKNLKRILESQT